MVDLTMGVPIILASGSVFRRQLLEQAGVRFSVVPAAIDEPALRAELLRKDPLIAPVAVATALACAKAEQVSGFHPDALVIGSDQVLACRDEIFGKPVSIAAARQQLLRLRGAVHSLPTAVVLARAGKILWSHVDEPRLTMRAFSVAFLDHYIEGEGRDVCATAGGYKIEGRGAQLFQRVEGDYFSVIGLPLMPLLDALRDHGVLVR